jgi:cytochrome d ubiquinol oxidase subunit II
MLEGTWFIIWGFLWAVYFMLDGFDLGLGTLLPIFGRSDKDRRIILNSMGPFWDGNEVWLITAAGVTFAAFPRAYAIIFSALYSPLLMILFGLILRGASLEFRGKLDSRAWRALWDSGIVIGSFLPTLLFGVAFANIFRGIPIDADSMYHGSLPALFNPYGLLGGLLFLLFFFVHGSLWLAIKSNADLQERAAAMAAWFWLILLFVSLLFFLATAFATTLYNNYLANPVLFFIPLIAVASLVMIRVFVAKRSWWKAWFTSGLAIVGITLFGFVGLYPNLLPSSLDPSFSLTAYNCASSHLTLKIMLGVVLMFFPIVIIYQAWVYSFFKGKITENDLVY